MPKVMTAPLPTGAFLDVFTPDASNYVDCYQTRIDADVDLEALIVALFNTMPFRIERRMLQILGRQSATDMDVVRLASGEADRFAMWHVTERDAQQVLMRVGKGPISTWMMARPHPDGTDLFFGSSVVPGRNRAGKAKPKGLFFWAFFWFHKIYSRILLGSAHRRLLRRKR